MSGAPLVELNKVGMKFRLHYERADTLKETLIRIVRRRAGYREFQALSQIDLHVEQGESVAIIGRNGSGKSTLLKIVAGVFEPTQGERHVRGSIAALIELGAGFNGELTGRENLYLNGAIMGLSKSEMQRRYDSIVDFSELRDFMDVPVKNYSSGMYARLGFAIATDVDADILLIDEILGVGDEAFQKKSYKRIETQLASAKTVIFVSHDASAVKRICQRAIVLVDGELGFSGATDEAIDWYHEHLEETTSGDARLRPLE